MSNESLWVYAIRNVETGERLIGGAADVDRAWHRHQTRLRAGTHTNLALQEAWEIRGADTFIVEWLEAVATRAALAARIHAWVQNERQTYNTNWSPRLRPRIVAYRRGDQVIQCEVHPPTTVHRIETAREMAAIDGDDNDATAAGDKPTAAPASSFTLDGLDAPPSPIIVAATTYHLPFSERDLPLIKTADGIEYVPVDAWCSALGVRLRSHLWRLQRKFLWSAARELVITLPNNRGVDPETREVTQARAAMIALYGAPTRAPMQSPMQSPTPPPSSTPGSRTPPAPSAPSEPTEPSESSGWPCWCLPRSYFLHVAWAVGLKWIDPAFHAAIRTMQDDEMDAEQRTREERGERIATYRVVRQRLWDTLITYERVLEMLRRADEELAPTRDAVEGAALAILCDQGRQLVRRCEHTARAALSTLHSGGITEFTAYDPEVDAMRTQIVPNDPTLPDERVMADLDAQEATLSAWLTTFHQRLHFHPPNTGGAFPEDM